MPILAGWLTGEQVPQEIIEQTLLAMGTVLGQHGGQPAHTIHPGAGLIAFSDTAYVMQQDDEPPVLDWVPDRRTLVYRRPLSGIHPLYYIENWPDQGNLLFASEIKALFAVGVPRRLHLASLDTLLRYGLIPAPWTAFEEIKSVPAGWILRWQRAKTVLNQATDYRLDEPITPLGTLDQLEASLNQATTNMLPSHEQLVTMTGGSLPSALSTILAAQHTTTPFTIASFGYTKSRTAKRWRVVEEIATACQRPLLTITGVDQPEFWTAAIAGIEAPSVETRPLALHQLLHTVAAETEARVAISGLGASILLNATTQRQKEQASEGQEQQDILDWYGQTLRMSQGKKHAQIWSQETQAAIRAAEPWEQSLHARKLARRAAQFAERAEGWHYLDLHLRLPDLAVQTAHQLATQERMVVRSPYLNTHIIDMLTRLPAVIDGETRKETLIAQLVQRHFPKMTSVAAKLPLTVPSTPLLYEGTSDLLQQTLSAESIRATGIFDWQAVQALIKQGEVSRELLLVFTTQLLCRLFSVEV